MKQFVIAVLLPGVVLAAIGCDMNKVDPGGGASSDSVVTVRSGSSAAPTGGDSSQAHPRHSRRRRPKEMRKTPPCVRRTRIFRTKA
jgi:hypothetical protein